MKRIDSMSVWASAILLASSALASAGEKPSAEGMSFFETKIRPVLVKHCYGCHSSNAKEVGGKLLLDSHAATRRGGESGPALVEGSPDESLLIQAIQYDGLQMPPEAPLPESVVQDFVTWIKLGAPDPRTAVESDGKPLPQGPATAEAFWSLQPVQDTPLPVIQDRSWPRAPLDHFVLAKIEAAGLKPTHDADARTLVRRLYYDVIGLPPTFRQIEELQVSIQHGGPSAVETLVDELLASPQFGERWGRAWLDVARYGESNGNDGLGRNPAFPHAWRYRDYVISAWNADVPYDQFLTEQIAGDLLPAESPEEIDRQLIATGFLAIGSKPAKAMNKNFDMDVVADQIDVISRGILGLSVGCARCHDHKFDPIPTRDYYALAGILTSTETLWGAAGHEALSAPATDLHVLKAAPVQKPPEGFVETVLAKDSATGKLKTIPKPKWPVGTPLAMGVRDRKSPADANINIKGEAAKTGASVPRGFLTACQVSDDIRIPESQSGRLQLAQWITHPTNPLTAHVMVNRVWLQLFGEGIVGTPDDFGYYGDRPTHPELLDHLATRFVAEGWSLKKLIRTIVLSRTYQLSSDADSSLTNADSQNLLLTRHHRRRLEAEALRDTMLQASGQLDLQPGEGSVIRHRDILVNLADNLHEPSRKRSVYLCYLRSAPPPELAAFDLPDFTTVLGRRDVSIVPSQALHLLNSPFVVEQADMLATWIQQEHDESRQRVALAWQQTLGREPNSDECLAALDLVKKTQAETNSEQKAWASLCQALLASNELRYVD
jgi:cytochrome c553